MRWLRALYIISGIGSVLLFLMPGQMRGSWVLVPTSEYSRYTCVYFVNGSTGVIAGGGTGAVARTTNAGASWTVQFLFLTYQEHWWDVYFPEPLIGYCVGDTGDCIRTTDGGVTWERRHTGVPYALTGVHFFDANTGIAVGTRGTILKTTNGGLTWRTISSGTTYNLYDLCFPDANNGYAVGITNDNQNGVVLKTTDAGETWTLNTISQVNLESVHFPVDASTGYTCDFWGTVLKTIDGGQSWSNIYAAPDTYFHAIFFKDNSTGFIVGNTYDGSSLVNLVLKTTDGGLTWQSEVLPDPVLLYEIYFVNADTGYIVGDAYYGSPSHSTIFRTTDGGGVWVAEEEENNLQEPKLVVSPNPFVNFTRVLGKEKERFSLYDVSGRFIRTFSGSRIGEGLSPGVYFLKSEKQGCGSVRIVKIK